MRSYNYKLKLKIKIITTLSTKVSKITNTKKKKPTTIPPKRITLPIRTIALTPPTMTIKNHLTSPSLPKKPPYSSSTPETPCTQTPPFPLPPQPPASPQRVRNPGAYLSIRAGANQRINRATAGASAGRPGETRFSASYRHRRYTAFGKHTGATSNQVGRAHSCAQRERERGAKQCCTGRMWRGKRVRERGEKDECAVGGGTGRCGNLRMRGEGKYDGEVWMIGGGD